MSSDYARLRDKWYRDGWFSERTCLDAFEGGAVDRGWVAVTFAAGGSASSPTVGDIHDGAVSLAASLQRLGVRTGDAVAVQLSNRVECAMAYQAILLCGAVLVPIVHIYGVAEVGFILAQSGVKVLIVPDRYRSISYRERLQELSCVATLRDIILLDAEPGPGYLAFRELDVLVDEYRRPAVDSDDVCLLLYTSGTTSAPKGVQHTHNAVLAE
jgi:acyl-coenzyme A synthetase/AMP-(fatty) acid ligase